MSDEVSQIEVEARRDGWVPEEEYRGPKEQWVDAETFVERGRQINPILRANNERLKKELETERKKHESELNSIKSSVEEFKQFQKEAYERKVQGYEAELRQLRAARSEATVQEDHEKAAEIDERIDEVKEKVAEAKENLKEKPIEEKKEAPAQIAPELQTWLNSNPWYGDADNYLEETELVTALGASIRKKFPNITGKAFLDKLDEKIEERLPDLRGSSKKGPSVEGTSHSKLSGGAGKKHSYENLPADAKEACDRFVASKLMTKEEYLANYEWE